jgi:hypothetical protein
VLSCPPDAGGGEGAAKGTSVSTQLQRYFASILGFAIAATWFEAGAVAALVCIVVAAAFYGVAVFLQPARAARREPRPRREPAPPIPHAVFDSEAADAPSEPSATGTYGW